MPGDASRPTAVGRYLLYERIAAGGMGAVHYGRMVGPRGFTRTVAIKRLHPAYAEDPRFVAMFLDEARIASRIRHPNVVATVDVVEANGEVLLVMDYVEGEALGKLLGAARRRGERAPLGVALRIVVDVLRGLDAAHEARGDTGEALRIVHRDVSPQNVLVGVDGIARVVDFGIAKAVGRAHSTRDGEVKGKLRYMAPEQLEPGEIDRRADVYAAGIVLWECLTNEHLRTDEDVPRLALAISRGDAAPPSKHAPVPPEVEAIVMTALAREPSERYAHAYAMADALEATGQVASSPAVAGWVRELAAESIAGRAEVLARMARDEPPSAPSALATTQPPSDADTAPEGKPRSRSRSRGRWLVTGAIVAVPAIALAVVALARTSRGSALSEARVPSAGSGEAALAAAPPALGASGSAPSPSPSGSGSAFQPASASASASAFASARPKPARAFPGTPNGPARAAPDCRVPYRVDSTGVRVPRPECL